MLPLLLFEALCNKLQKDFNLLPSSKELLFLPAQYFCAKSLRDTTSFESASPKA